VGTSGQQQRKQTRGKEGHTGNSNPQLSQPEGEGTGRHLKRGFHERGVTLSKSRTSSKSVKGAKATSRKGKTNHTSPQDVLGAGKQSSNHEDQRGQVGPQVKRQVHNAHRRSRSGPDEEFFCGVLKRANYRKGEGTANAILRGKKNLPFTERENVHSTSNLEAEVEQRSSLLLVQKKSTTGITGC